jgi:hypothetical protein
MISNHHWNSCPELRRNWGMTQSPPQRRNRAGDNDDHCHCPERSEKSVDSFPFPRTPPGSLKTVFVDQGRHHGWSNYDCNHRNEVGSKWAGVGRGCLYGIHNQAGLTWNPLGRITFARHIRWNPAIPKGVSQAGDHRVMEGSGAIAQSWVASKNYRRPLFEHETYPNTQPSKPSPPHCRFGTKTTSRMVLGYCEAGKTGSK